MSTQGSFFGVVECLLESTFGRPAPLNFRLPALVFVIRSLDGLGSAACGGSVGCRWHVLPHVFRGRTGPYFPRTVDLLVCDFYSGYLEDLAFPGSAGLRGTDGSLVSAFSVRESRSLCLGTASVLAAGPVEQRFPDSAGPAFRQ